MELQDRLDMLKKQFESGAPPEALSIMHQSTDDLLNSGILDHTLKKGDWIPEFTLPDERDQEVNSSELLTAGPLVISFYRGVW